MRYRDTYLLAGCAPSCEQPEHHCLRDMGGGGGTTATNTIQNSDPWTGVQPHLMNVFGGGQDIYNRGTYQGQYLANQSPYSVQAQNMLAQRGAQGSPLTGAASSQLQDTISGKYLDPGANPYFKSAVGDALGQAASTFAGQYGGAAGNNLSGTGYQEGLQRTLGQLATNAYSGEYDRERQNQLSATQLAPSFQNMDYQNLQALQQAGLLQEARGQQEIGAQQAAFQSPWENLANYQRAITGQFGGQSNTQGQSPYFTNPMANAMGLGLGGLALYNGANTAGLIGSGALGAGAGAGTAGMADIFGTMGAFALA